jgi:hypothetical protein
VSRSRVEPRVIVYPDKDSRKVGPDLRALYGLSVIEKTGPFDAWVDFRVQYKGKVFADTLRAYVVGAATRRVVKKGPYVFLRNKKGTHIRDPKKTIFLPHEMPQALIEAKYDPWRRVLRALDAAGRIDTTAWAAAHKDKVHDVLRQHTMSAQPAGTVYVAPGLAVAPAKKVSAPKFRRAMRDTPVTPKQAQSLLSKKRGILAVPLDAKQCVYVSTAHGEYDGRWTGLRVAVHENETRWVKAPRKIGNTLHRLIDDVKGSARPGASLPIASAALQALSGFVSNDDNRWGLNGAHLMASGPDGVPTLAATNGSILGWVNLPESAEVDEHPDLVPVQLLQHAGERLSYRAVGAARIWQTGPWLGRVVGQFPHINQVVAPMGQGWSCKTTPTALWQAAQRVARVMKGHGYTDNQIGHLIFDTTEFNVYAQGAIATEKHAPAHIWKEDVSGFTWDKTRRAMDSATSVFINASLWAAVARLAFATRADTVQIQGGDALDPVRVEMTRRGSSAPLAGSVVMPMRQD